MHIHFHIEIIVLGKERIKKKHYCSENNQKKTPKLNRFTFNSLYRLLLLFINVALINLYY